MQGTTLTWSKSSKTSNFVDVRLPLAILVVLFLCLLILVPGVPPVAIVSYSSALILVKVSLSLMDRPEPAFARTITRHLSTNSGKVKDVNLFLNSPVFSPVPHLLYSVNAAASKVSGRFEQSVP